MKGKVIGKPSCHTATKEELDYRRGAVERARERPHPRMWPRCETAEAKVPFDRRARRDGRQQGAPRAGRVGDGGRRATASGGLRPSLSLR